MTFKGTKCTQLVNVEQILLCPIICFKNTRGVSCQAHTEQWHTHTPELGGI